uniref:SAC3/GANP/THP3 conserved domain-containing protein n=1 Tax=Ditylenchus dipsaci TaxID=166011 RepID=A0A915CXC2_9BILA
MYDDLAAEGIFCSSESEFRSYDMILNWLTRMCMGKFCRIEKRQLRNHASFLQACLCQRYFPMVRHSSLKTICSAYRLFPLDRFIDILAFDNSTDAIEFLLAFGIEMDQADESYIDVTEGSAWLEMKIGGRPIAEVLSNGPCENVQILSPLTLSIPITVTLVIRSTLLAAKILSREKELTSNSPSQNCQEAKPSFFFAKPTLNLLPETNKPTSVFSSNLFSISKPKLASYGFVDNSKLQQPSPFSFVSNSAVDAPATKPAFLSASVFGQKLPLTSNLSAQPSTVWSQVQSNGDSKSSLPMFAANPETCQQKIPSQPSAIETEAKLEEERKAVAKAEAETKRKAEIEARRQAEIAKQKAEMEARRKKEELKLVAEQFIDSQVKLILESLVQRELETIAAEIREEAELFQSKLTRFQDNLFNMWLRQFTDQWKSIVKRNKLLRSISLRQQEGLTIAKARRSIAELCSPSNSTMPQPKRRRITAEQMELCLYARHYNAVRTKQLAKVYFAKWRQYVVDRRKRSYFESFFIQATYMGSYENGKWTKRWSQESEE